jgi:hypothetical protein
MTINKRATLHTLMADTLADEIHHHNWTYEPIRPMNVPSSYVPGRHVIGDCSKGVQYLCHWAGVSDPMKMHYGPYGNSQTLAASLQHLDRASDLEIGDIITFGIDGSAHAAMVKERGSDPLLWSFGHQGAPNEYHLSQDRRPHQFLRNPIEAYVPTSADKLRAKTGYWAWLQWRLGEGSWAHYPPASKSVRPHVPHVIPLRWWRRYRKFLANRHMGSPRGTTDPE